MKKYNIDIDAFWNRVDALREHMLLKDLCQIAGLDPNKVMHNRSDKRLMNSLDTYCLARSLNVTMEYLLLGEEEEQGFDSRLKEAFKNADEVTKQMVYRILGVEYKGN